MKHIIGYFRRRYYWRVALLLVWLGGGAGIYAQNYSTLSTPFDHKTPSGLAPGSPAGVYPLSGFDTINPYNGNLNFRLPLIQVGGRGSAAFTSMLALNTKNWSVHRSSFFTNGEETNVKWTPTTDAWSSREVGYGPGVMVGRQSGFDTGTLTCTNPPLSGGQHIYRFTMTTLTFIAPDGTEYEFRDKDSEGKPQEQLMSDLARLCNTPTALGASRGSVFVTTDGSAATFISDTTINDRPRSPSTAIGFWFYVPSGVLKFKDGMTYRIDNGLVTWIRDRNGNRVSFTYNGSGVAAITDSLNRQITFTYNYQDVAPYGLCDRITFSGYGGATRIIRISKTNLGSALRSDYSLQTYAQLFPELNGSLGFSGNFDTSGVISYVWLPDGRFYRFLYNSYWELARVELPTGGAFEYDYNPGSGVRTRSNGIENESVIYRRVKERRVLPDGVTVESRMVYTLDANNNFTGQVDQLDSSGVRIASSKHYYLNGNVSLDSLFQTPQFKAYSGWYEGKEAAVESLRTDDLTPLRRVDYTWQQRAPVGWLSWWTSNNGLNLEPSNDPRMVTTITTLVDTNQMSKQTAIDPSNDTVGIDQYNNQTDVYEYDFGIGAPGSLIRHTHTDYVTSNNGADYAGDNNIHIRSLPLQQQIFDAGGIKRAETLYEYDNYNPVPFHAALGDRQNISGHDGAFSSGYLTRGNLTLTSRSLLDNNGNATGSISSYAQYDIAGNAVKAIDANGNPTTLDFSDRFGSPGDDAEQNTPPAELNGQTAYAFATKVINALNQTAYTKYDYHLGKPVNSEDANGIVSSVEYNDALDRPTQGIQARYKVGVGALAEKRQTTITYGDVNRVIATTSDRDTYSDNKLSSKSYYDGLGRTFRSAAYEGSPGWTIKDTQFDALGRVSQVSNPYRVTNPDSASPPAGLWTATNYDALSRVASVITPDGATVSTAYNGNQVTVTDQAGKKRSSQTDALGRLVKVTEDPGGLNYDTTYFYDPLGNLRAVNQGGQGRWFAYDSLSRLIRVRNPEQNCANLPPYTDPYTGAYCWATAYSYDANGNLTQRTDANGIVSKYYYDALNRNWGIDYINGSQKSNVARVFDGAVNGIGRLYWERTQDGGTQEMGTNVAFTGIDSYDALGRPLQNRQHFWQASTQWGPGYYFHQTYDLAGNLKTMTYPSGHIVNYSYDQAGRLASFSGNLGGSTATYADTISYNPAGQMSTERFGTNTSLYHKKRYNNRLQLVDLRLSTGSDELSWDRGAITFYYGWNGYGTANPFIDDPINNGNLLAQLHYVPTANSAGYVQTQGDVYGYDALNRITNANESQWDGNAVIPDVYKQNFSYDPWGNRKVTSATGGVSNYSPTYDYTNNPNRIVGLGYDAAGNITSDPLTGGLMTYDPENRMVTATNGIVSRIYTYDADGKRVKQIVGMQETWYIYGIGGELLAEYAAGGAWNAPQKEYGYRNGQLLVTAEPWSGGNLAWGKATSQSSTNSGGESSRVVDGNTDGNWGDNSVSHTNSEHQPWWQVDLGSVQQIGTVRLWNRTDCCPERLSNFYVLVSDNPFSSTDLTTTINQAGVSSYYTAGQAGLLTQIVAGRSGRYVRVQLAGDNYLSLAEVEVMAGAASGVGVKWLVQDHLGSTRMVVDQTGSLGGIRRHDFAPFGEELVAGIRSTMNDYSGDSVRQKFDGYERDDETKLDFAQARYFGSLMGRFTSPDDFLNDSDVPDPQSWNKYAYSRNNPLKFSDPTGRKATVNISYDPSSRMGTITISASFAVYSPNREISQADLQKQADLLKKQIESTYSGSFTENGITFTVSANITAQALSESEATKLGNEGKVDNLVAVLNGEYVSSFNPGGSMSDNNYAFTYRVSGENFDRTTIAGGRSIESENTYPHEFGHSLGFGSHLSDADVMGNAAITPARITRTDFSNIFGSTLEAYKYALGCSCIPPITKSVLRSNAVYPDVLK